MLHVIITAHYPKSDPEFMGDYYDIEIVVTGENRREVQTYGDFYHDKGADKAAGFVDACYMLCGNRAVHVEHSKIADREDL